MPRIPNIPANLKKIPTVIYTRAAFIITNILRVILLIAIITASIKQDWLVLFLSTLSLFLTYLPAIIKRNYKITLPVELELAVIIFIFATLFMGEVRGFFIKFWWWDVLLHGASAIVIGFMGFLIIFSLYISKKVKMQPLFVAIFSFSFAIAIGALWEIFEFGMDQIFQTNMQKSGLVDTMWDLIVDALGAIVTAIAGYFYTKYGHVRGFSKLLEKFVKANPNLFKK